jgi:hypothetical protein
MELMWDTGAPQSASYSYRQYGDIGTNPHAHCPPLLVAAATRSPPTIISSSTLHPFKSSRLITTPTITVMTGLML